MVPLCKIDLISLFGESFFEPLKSSILGRAQKKGLVTYTHTDLRPFGLGVHQKVDDAVYGGGPGMVLCAPVLQSALQSVHSSEGYVVHLSPQGQLLNQKKCFELAQKKHLILIAGHYEGLDERFIEQYVDEEISIGDYVVTNGALASLVLIDSVVRLIPGVLGDSNSSHRDSFVNGLLDCPHYTRPFEFNGMRVPEVLLSGDHRAIDSWRYEEARRRTEKRRADLYFSYLAEKTESDCDIGCGKLSLVRIGDRTQSMARFLKRLGLKAASWDDYQVHFKDGITLAKGKEKAYPILCIYTVASKAEFERLYRLFLREQMPIGRVQSRAKRLEASFIDEEGWPWILIYSKEGEQENGNESMD